MTGTFNCGALVTWWQAGHPDTEVLALTGSQAAGDAGPHSDIDLIAIGPYPEFVRVRGRWLGISVEAMVAPWEWYEGVIMRYERESNIGTITGMVANGLCLLGDGGPWRRLKALARDNWARGPEALSERELDAAYEKIRTLWANFLDAPDAATRQWLGWTLLTTFADVRFKERRWWAVKPRLVLTAWALGDPREAARVHEIMGAGFPEEDLRMLLASLVDRLPN